MFKLRTSGASSPTDEEIIDLICSIFEAKVLNLSIKAILKNLFDLFLILIFLNSLNKYILYS
jgi:hypothetical protein